MKTDGLQLVIPYSNDQGLFTFPTTIMCTSDQGLQISDIKTLFDTGANITCISQSVVEVLSPKLYSKETKFLAYNQLMPHQYCRLNIVFDTETTRQILYDVECLVSPRPYIELLLGMDIICLGDFRILHSKNQLFQTFAMPPYHL